LSGTAFGRHHGLFRWGSLMNRRRRFYDITGHLYRRRALPWIQWFKRMIARVELAINIGIAKYSLHIFAGLVERNAFDKFRRLAEITPHQPLVDAAGSGIVRGEGSEPVAIPVIELLTKILGAELDADRRIQQLARGYRTHALL